MQSAYSKDTVNTSLSCSIRLKDCLIVNTIENNVFTDHVTKALKKSDKLTLPGFGTFPVSKRKARTGKNPLTGKRIKIPATKVAKFKPGNLLKSAVK